MSGRKQFRAFAALCWISIFALQVQGQNNAPDNSADRGAPIASAAAAASPLRSTYIPLTQRQRFHYYVEHMFSPESVLRSAASAGLNQANNTPAEWGQGMSGYGQRFASSYGEHMVQSSSMYATGALLHEDNRYYLSGESSRKAKIKYALLSSFMARHDDGSRHFSFSRVSSYAVAAGVSRLWQPPSTRDFGSFLSSFAIGIGADAGFNVARELFPRILHSRPPVASYTGSAQ